MVPFNSDNSGVSMRVTAVIFLVNLWLSAAQQCNEKFNIPKFSFDGYKFKCEVKMVYDDTEFDYERYILSFHMSKGHPQNNIIVARSKMYECKTKAPVGTNPTGVNIVCAIVQVLSGVVKFISPQRCLCPHPVAQFGISTLL